MIDSKAMFKIGYGLYVLTAHEDGKDNGCIVNTFQQVTGEPLRVSVAVNKANYTCGMIERTGVFNVSVIAESATFDLFRRFGFQSGKTADKFADFPSPRCANGVLGVDRNTNAIVCAKVFSTVDLGTHLLFLADVTDALVKSSEETATYSYSQKSIKPKPQAAARKGWRCLICGYFYEGEELPKDFVCPVCKHPASDFERVDAPAPQAGATKAATLKGSKTEANLKAAFAGESQARYRRLEKNIATGEVWERIGADTWQCRNCGAIVKGAAAPDVCPVCDHPKAYFQLPQGNF